MKFNKFFLYIASATLFFFSACEEDELMTRYSTDGATTELAKKIISGSNGYVGHLFKDTLYTVTQGVDVVEMEILSGSGLAVKMFLFEINLDNPKLTLLASSPDDDNTLGKKQKMTLQAMAKDSETNKVWGAVNADFFTKAGIPQSIFYKNGVALKATLDSPVCTFFAITKDLRPLIGSYDEYDLYKDQIKEAVGGRVRLMTNGSILAQTNTVKDPRTAIGITADNKVYILVADGRNFWYSNGMTYTEMANVFSALGVQDAINLDGGGSSTFIIRNTPDFAADRFRIRNWPYDGGGAERAVANGLLIVERK